jgi:hypothetical protein
MRRFHSYGPVDCELHFCVERKQLIEQCTHQLIGHPEKGGHYFTIWAPRQNGKTWIIKQSVEHIKTAYRDSFFVIELSMQSYADSENEDTSKVFFRTWKQLFSRKLKVEIDEIKQWQDWLKLFETNSNLFDKPLILLIDEFDKLPRNIIDQVVAMFRDMYLSREDYLLHGLALVGVRAVLGIDSKNGSPFNVQRSIHIPNLTFEEVELMFDDYQTESGQKIDPLVVQQIYEATNGQPGLIGWFGELLTEKYNDDPIKTIDIIQWNKTYARSIHIEHNNTLLNMIIKAKTEYKPHVLHLFQDANIKFSFASDWCNYMYMHGLIRYHEIEQDQKLQYICQFSCPYVQDVLYNVFVLDIENKHNRNVLALEPVDCLEDVLNGPTLNLPALLKRYKAFLERLKDKGNNPWQDQPRRKTDYHLTEAVGHFHLYFWLKMALDDICTIIPEFPTGNGKVDLHIKYKSNKKGLIEVKSFVNALKLRQGIIQASDYAAKTAYSDITIALFAPFTDENVLNQLSTSQTINNVTVHVVAIGQG